MLWPKKFDKLGPAVVTYQPVKFEGNELGKLKVLLWHQGVKRSLTETKSGYKLSLKTYFDGRMSVEHVLQIEVAAVVQMLPAEVLDELKVVQTVCQ